MSGLLGLSSSDSHITNLSKASTKFLQNSTTYSRTLNSQVCPRALVSTGKVHEIDLPASHLEVTSNLLSRVPTALHLLDWVQHNISASLPYLKLSCARCLTLQARYILCASQWKTGCARTRDKIVMKTNNSLFH
jgi:hypothetical protein